MRLNLAAGSEVRPKAFTKWGVISNPKGDWQDAAIAMANEIR